MADDVLYPTAATLLPVFWVVIVFQMRLFGKEPKGGWLSLEADDQHRSAPFVFALIVALAGLAMFVAELTAINVLVDGDPSSGAKRMVKIGLLVGAFFAFFAPTMPWVEVVLDRTPVGWIKRRLYRDRTPKD